ncbi:grasp-with-spasm system SPASM domain peptide maturase [Flavobacterium sp.]|uniref:grasp-with-spasm system SPASM domain peptide maturase n=1 Tax=Flavobacterium sp. TaxID=239 RepID=UPI0026118067|nr:grasp-with-spasm system SPASM domain peptide maturase [Flavobacterium sp.]
MKYFKLFATCIIVKGYRRSSISDLERNKNYIIPNFVADFLLKENITMDVAGNLKQWIDLFVKEELGFFTRYPEYYPSLSLEWDSPEMINNAIIEADNLNEIALINLIDQLNDLNCRYIEFRFYFNIKIPLCEQILVDLHKGGVSGIVIYGKYDANDMQSVQGLLAKNNSIVNIVFHSCNEKNVNDNPRIYITNQIINSSIHCGQISQDYFSINIKTFTESNHFNTCLNKKIAIDIDGNIKNCPSMKKNYGNIKDTKLIDVIDNSCFKDYWSIKKDLIDVCKNCEFRHICIDCRAYIDEPDNMFSKPLKCGYNPYTNEWSKWNSGNSKKMVMEYYGL